MKKEGFFIEEIKGDLFGVESSFSLGHCVSQDLVMGKGIAVEFKERFGNVDKLKQQKGTIGNGVVLEISSQNRFVFYLITKLRYFDKPKIEMFESSLIWMKNYCIEKNIKKLALPKIGCGLDLLIWTDVKKMLVKVFQETDIHIKIYFL